MSVMDEVNSQLNRVAALTRGANRMMHRKLQVGSERWLAFFEEEFANLSDRLPFLVEPLQRRLEDERSWYARLSQMNLRMSATDATILIAWRRELNLKIEDLLIEAGLGVDEIFDSSDWRQQLFVRDSHLLNALAWFAESHRTRMYDFALRCDARASDEALAAIQTIVRELKEFRDVTLPSLLQFSQPHATSF